MTSTRVLVTGATGFLGQNLVRYLMDEGYRVSATSRSEQGTRTLEGIGANVIQGDLQSLLRDPLALDLPHVEMVVHVAGAVSGSLQEMKMINGQITERLAELYAARPEPPRFVYISSVAAAGPSRREHPKMEAEPPQPISNYGISKLEGEKAVCKFAKIMSVAILRPGIVFGPGDLEFLKLLRTMNRTRLNPVVGKGSQPISFIEVYDLVRLIKLVAEGGGRVLEVNSSGISADGQGIYYAADPQPLALTALSELFHQATGQKVRSLHLPVSAGFALGAFSEAITSVSGIKSTLNRDKIREAIAEGWWGACGKAVEELGWSPVLPIQETMVNWIRTAKEQKLL